MTIEVAFGDSCSSYGKLLYSDRHDNCHCIIAVNLATGEAHMFHVWDGADKGLSPMQKENAEEFANKPGDKLAISIESARSLITVDEGTGKEAAQQYLEQFGIRFLPKLEINDEGKKWGVVFNPKTGKAKVTLDENKKVLFRGTLFHTLPHHHRQSRQPIRS